MPLSLKTDSKAFRATMENKAANLKIGGERRIIRFAKTLHTLLEDVTPKLTGKATAEWQIALNAQPTSELMGRQRPPTIIDYEAYAAAARQELDGYESGMTIYITNNAPYIEALNRGSSIQAPAGFVELCEAEAIAQLKATFKGVSNG